MLKYKTPSLNGPFEYISLRDNALDGDHENFVEEFQKYREGSIPNPPLKDGVEPTRFKLQPIYDSDLELKLFSKDKAEMHGAYARHAMVGLENYFDEKGQPVKFYTERVDGYEVVAKSICDALGAPVLAEVGQAVMLHSLPNPD